MLCQSFFERMVSERTLGVHCRFVDGEHVSVANKSHASVEGLAMA